MATSIERMPGRPGEQDHGGQGSQQGWFDDEPEREHGEEDDRYRQRVAKPYWK